MEQIPDFVVTFLELLSFLFITAVGAGFLWLIYAYITDVTQTESTLRRNYPVIARFRYFFERYAFDVSFA